MSAEPAKSGNAPHPFSIRTPEEFDKAALRTFQFQYDNNPLYRRYADLLGKNPAMVQQVSEIPFLPISFFKTHAVKTTLFEEALLFESSGTTGTRASRHYVKEPSLYEQSVYAAFGLFFGKPEGYCFLALLPSYLERSASSLVYMMQKLMDKSKHPDNGFYLHNHQKLHQTLQRLEAKGQKTLLIGVTYALLDFASQHPVRLQNTLVMETGGMKGRRREVLREEVHQTLQHAFGLSTIHSEYGMTELLSQAYSKEGGLFQSPPWMKVGLRPEDDPVYTFFGGDTGPGTGALNIIDLANTWSCSFIATEDVGRCHPSGRFEVLGRLDNSDIRGCSLLTPDLGTLETH